MQYKLKRGKYRPSLLKYIENLSNDNIICVTKEAFLLYDDNFIDSLKDNNNNIQVLKEIMKILCQLRGIGPATASLILNLYDQGEYIPFMGDEALIALESYIGKRKYTLKHYIEYYKYMNEKKNQLNQLNKATTTRYINVDIIECVLFVKGWKKRHKKK